MGYKTHETRGIKQMRSMILEDNIRSDYKVVENYATMAATAIIPEMHNKSFKKHIPYKTHEFARHWGRDKWSFFDGLPKEFRDMVNDDPISPDTALDAALVLWQDMTRDAERAMDRIIGYENSINNLPSWLTTNETKEMQIIRDLRAKREEMARRAEEEYKKAMQRRREQEAADRERSIRIGGWYSYHTMKDGTRLSNVEVLDRRGMAPHVYRELLAKSKPAEFTKHSFYVAPKTVVPDYDVIDNKAPEKINPMQIARGRNH